MTNRDLSLANAIAHGELPTGGCVTNCLYCGSLDVVLIQEKRVKLTEIHYSGVNAKRCLNCGRLFETAFTTRII
jgi:hypothetical protein